MAWSASSRARLNSLWNSGVVAVRYQVDGCNVELELLECVAKGTYRYKPYAMTDTKVVRSRSELFSEFPIGAAELSGKLRDDDALRTDYMLVGVAQLPIETRYRLSDLEGAECSRATHVVSRVYIGGFALVSGSSSELAAEASFFQIGSGASKTASVQGIAREGDPSQCERALRDGSKQALCSVPLKVGMRPIEGLGESLCPSGTEMDAVRSQCVRTTVIEEKKVDCPKGSKWDGRQCRARLRKGCPKGYQFVVDTGCVPKVVAAPSQPASPQTASTGRGPRLVWIASGKFTMGSLDGDANERLASGSLPTYEIDGFWLDETEVTVAQYRACVQAGACRTPSAGASCTWSDPFGDDSPMTCVDLADAEGFCGWAGKRLPTEFEWEFAARGVESNKYPWGAQPPSDQVCWSGFNEQRSTPCRVASRLAAPSGLFDLAGNVWEWTSSRHCGWLGNYCDAREAVIRGGSWTQDSAFWIRASARHKTDLTRQASNLGFRCAANGG